MSLKTGSAVSLLETFGSLEALNNFDFGDDVSRLLLLRLEGLFEGEDFSDLDFLGESRDELELLEDIFVSSG